ncbi:MAG TPA: 2-deoxyribose-5-phosphate aldolase, partial [Chitinophagaceae bacterium]
MNIASYIDHTALKPTTSVPEIGQLCAEAAAYEFAAVCVPPPFIKRAKILLEPTRVKTATVIGFPFGYS